MKKFAFRFEAVAKVRRIEMERQARVLAETQMKVKSLESEIENLVGQTKNEIVRLQTLAARGLLTQQLMNLSDRYRTDLKVKLNHKRLELRDWENKVREEREKLIDKEKRRKVIETVRERDLESYYTERKKDEAKYLDEVASQLWTRHITVKSDS